MSTTDPLRRSRNDAHFCPSGAKFVEQNPIVQTAHVLRREPSRDRRSIRLFDPVPRMEQGVGELTVIGEQERAARRIVESPDRHDARAL